MEPGKSIFNDTLLRYNKPIVVSKRAEDPHAPIAYKTQSQHSGVTKTDLSVLKIEKDQSIQDVLNCIFPPREWEENGKRWLQTVSSEPVTKKSVEELEEELDTALRIEGARDTGICPIRRKLYDHCFDELLRQEAIYCCERGLLLKLVRDNLRMELSAMEELYVSSIAYGLRKTLLAEEEKADNLERIAAHKEGKTTLENEIKELNLKIELFELSESEQRANAEVEHQKVVEELKEEHLALREKLEKVIYPKK